MHGLHRVSYASTLLPSSLLVCRTILCRHGDTTAARNALVWIARNASHTMVLVIAVHQEKITTVSLRVIYTQSGIIHPQAAGTSHSVLATVAEIPIDGDLSQWH